MKRLHILTIFAVLTLLLCCILPTRAEAATEGYYTYTVSNGEAAITDCDTSISGAITIPSTLGGYPVTCIGATAFRDCSSLTSITIPDGVTSIGESAFYNCSNLISAIFGEDSQLTRIGSFAFQRCSNLTSIKIPNSVSSIGEFAFCNCDGLASVTIPAGITIIGCSVFSDCYSLTSVTIPNSVISLDSFAFWNCINLTSIIIPDSVTSIGYAAFENCNKLSHVAYTGSQSQWNRITFDSSNSELTEATRHYETVFQTLDNCMETSTYCPVCQITLTRTEKPDGSHSFATATCTTPKTCTICGIAEGEAAGHSGQWIELVTATCTTDGINARICSVCGETETLNIVAPGHKYSSIVTVPTCTEKGYTTKTCATCGEVSVTDYVDANGHSYSSVVVEPTCTEQGYTTKTCATCGDVTTEYVPAKGHGWSAWITTVKPTCTTEGAQMRFCNCGTRETEVIAKLPHSCENYICTVCGELDYANTVLTGAVQANWNLTQDLYIDLNGFDLSGTIITNGYKIYGMDSTTDNYTCESIGYFTCVDENGNYIVPERIYTEGEKQYMAICTEDRYSFHRFFVGTTHMSLEPEAIGLGYKAAVFGDEMVFAELAETKAFSFKLQLEGYTPVYRHFDSSELTSGESIALRIRNYDVENYSEHNLYAQVSLTLSDGTTIEAEPVSLTFRWLAEQVNENYTDYTADQLASFKAMLQQFDIVKKWNIPNLI